MHDRVTLATGALCLGLFLAFFVWQTPGILGQRLSAPEIDDYLARIERQLVMAPARRAALIRRLRGWAEADDGRPVYMLNLMRFRDRLTAPPAGTPAVSGTPEQVNARYEAAVRPMILRLGGFPQLVGPTLGANVLETDRALDSWDRVAIVRHPNRRTFLEFISNPAYAEVEPLKTMAMEVVLVPFAGALVLPDLRWVVGSILLAVLLATGWWRTARRVPHRSKPGPLTVQP